MIAKLMMAMLLSGALLSCGNSTKTDSTSDTLSVDSLNADLKAMTGDIQPAVGVYHGILPAADADGFDTTLELKADGSFVQTQTAKGNTDTEDGIFSIVQDTLCMDFKHRSIYGILRGDSIMLLDSDKKPTIVPYILQKRATR